jgi:hypothetical protein
MAKANKGLRTYEGQEGLNASLGQVGFKLCTAASTTVTADIIGFHIISKTTGTAIATMSATSKIGDSISAVAMESGTFVYGPFSAVTAAISGSACSVIVYYG